VLAPHLESVPADPDALVFIAGGHTAPSQFELPAAALAAGLQAAGLPASIRLHDCRHSRLVADHSAAEGESGTVLERLVE
jgi:hypothetical protein